MNFSVRNTRNGKLVTNNITQKKEWVEAEGYSDNLKVVFHSPDSGFDIPTTLEASRIADWVEQKKALNQVLLCKPNSDYIGGKVTEFDNGDIQVIYRAATTPMVW
tara:strand:+ start:11344 stop:11658 length:315 start_codon:yes stop_codon:yes gene_type:complete